MKRSRGTARKIFPTGHRRSVSFFAEWPIYKLDDSNKLILPLTIRGQEGCLVLSMRVNDEMRRDPRRCNGILATMCGSNIASVHDEMIADNIRQSEWVLGCQMWVSFPSKPCLGRPVWQGVTNFLFVEPSGRLCFNFVYGPSVAPLVAEIGENALLSHMPILGLGLSFCHCKNVVIREQEADEGQRWHQMHKVPRIRFRTLDIGPIRQVIRREGRDEEVSIKQALHTVRGHFVTYTPEHPMFGKYAGTFWCPEHSRGSAEHGVVIKDYAVNSSPGLPKPAESI